MNLLLFLFLVTLIIGHLTISNKQVLTRIYLSEESTPLFKSKRLLTSNEFEFLSRLERACPEFRFHAQVCMGAILDPRTSRSNYVKYNAIRNKIAKKMIDFVAEDRVTGNIIALIELDDRTHDVKRDELRDSYTSGAGFKTIRWQSNNKPDVAEIRLQLLGISSTIVPFDNLRPELMPIASKSGISIAQFYTYTIIVFLILASVIIFISSRNVLAKHPASVVQSTTVVPATKHYRLEQPESAIFTQVNNIIRLWNAETSLLNGKEPEKLGSYIFHLKTYRDDLTSIKSLSCATDPLLRIEHGMNYILYGLLIFQAQETNANAALLQYLSKTGKYAEEDTVDYGIRQSLKVTTSINTKNPKGMLTTLYSSGERQIKHGLETLEACKN